MPNSSEFNPRALMELAIEEMLKSVHEPREDGKASPMVGAVLVKPDGSVEKAHRGELRHGDHAEFTLLERKNRASKLDGGKLFATLEPCAPGARNHPKLGCAERIVNARISEVWIGIEDPDPTVAGDGRKHLIKHNIKVHMFDSELQDQIRESNKQFLGQAMERKMAAEQQQGEVVDTATSLLEKPVAAADFRLFDQMLGLYCHMAKLGLQASSDYFKRLVVQQGLFKEVDGRLIATGFGLILFGEYAHAFPQARLLGTIHYPDGQEEPKNFESPLILVPIHVINWLKDKLPNPIDRSTAQRTEVNDKFYELVREGVVNALAHRDYEIVGAKSHIVVTEDTIQIKSPGLPIPPITLEQMQAFNAPMLSRNPILHYVFSQIEMAEERGLGLKSMRLRAQEAGLPLPTYEWHAPYLVLTLYRTSAAAAQALGQEVLSKLTPEEQQGWRFVSTKDNFTQKEYAEKMEVTARTAQRHLGRFVELGILHRIGKGPSTRYSRVGEA